MSHAACLNGQQPLLNQLPLTPVTFAIVTPSYNKARYVRRCLASVLDQHHAKVDYWVLDNCSDDGTRAILEDIQQRESARVNIVVERDRGQAAAINRGFSLAHGDIMGWLNADDFYAPHTLAAVESFFQQHRDVDLVYGRARLFDGAFRLQGEFPVQEPNLKVLLSYDYIPQPTAFWRRKVWETAGPLDETLNWGLDWDFFIRVTKQHRIAFLDTVLAEVVLDGTHKTATGGLAKTRELARISRRHGGWWQPTNLFCHYVLALHWLAGPWLRRPATAERAHRWLGKLQSYGTTCLFRSLGAQVMC